MRVDHRCFDVAMPQQLLNRSNVIAAFKDVRGKGMPECVVRGPLREPGLRHGLPDGFNGGPGERPIASASPEARWCTCGRGHLEAGRGPTHRLDPVGERP